VSSGRRRSYDPRALRSPRQDNALRSPREELAEATAHGQVYLRGLQRAQFGLSMLALVAFGAVFGVLPIALYLLPHLSRSDLFGIPISLWIVVVPMLPVFLAIGWLYARRADALDDSFRDLVER
jgi:putative solute:sodium symporter small subunit